MKGPFLRPALEVIGEGHRLGAGFAAGVPVGHDVSIVAGGITVTIHKLPPSEGAPPEIHFGPAGACLQQVDREELLLSIGLLQGIAITLFPGDAVEQNQSKGMPE
jgi:hypothetical protein